MGHIQGRKHWRVAKQKDAAKLRPTETEEFQNFTDYSHFEADLFAENLDLENVEVFDAIVQPGEVMYIPPGKRIFA
jgi:ribosomal protein L16 Arg81 hydroxylase